MFNDKTNFFSRQRLAGATLLVFANKQDLPGALSKEAIREVRFVLTENTMTRFWFDGICNKGLSDVVLLSSRHWAWTRSRLTTGASSAAVQSQGRTC